MMPANKADRQSILRAGWVGLIASLIVGVGELLLHFSATGYGGEGPYPFLVGVSAERLCRGHFLSVLAAPFYLVGYWHLYRCLAPAGKRMAQAVFFIGSYGFVIGTAWLASRIGLALLVQADAAAGGGETLRHLIDAYDAHGESLVQVIRVTTALVSIGFVGLILTGRSRYPRWMALFNPILLLALVFASYFAVPAVGKYLVPTAMNVAHFGVFGASLFALRKAMLPPEQAATR
jgi:hypothetical protein